MKIPADNLHNLATQLALFCGPTLLGAENGTSKQHLMVLQNMCYEKLSAIGVECCTRPRVRFIDLQRAGIELAQSLADNYERPGDCLLEIESQRCIRALILRSLRCMSVVSDERTMVLREQLEAWSEQLFTLTGLSSAYGGGHQYVNA